MSIKEYAGAYAEEWRNWQTEVVRLVRQELAELAPIVHSDDFDWDSWRFYFNAGYLPLDAIKLALSINPSDQSVIDASIGYSSRPMHFAVD